MKIPEWILVAVCTTLSISIIQCGLFDTTSTIEINLNSGPFSTDGNRSFKPGIVTGGTLTVETRESGRIVKSFDKNDDTIRMVVPSGKQRKIELEINLDPDIKVNPGPLLSFIGTATADLAPNEIKHVSLRMIPGRTKLVAPDYGMKRIVQFDNLNGDNFSTYQPLDTVGALGLTPNDLDMDSRGNIYIAYFFDALVSPNYFIVKTDRISGAAKTLIPVGQPVSAIGIDKYRNLLYFYTTGAQIFQIDLNSADITTAEQKSIPLPPTYTIISAIDADREGNVYILSGATSTFAAKVNPQTGAITAELVGSPLVSPMDMVVRENLLYIGNSFNSTPGNEILVLRTSDMSVYTSGGNRITAPSVLSGDFFSPRRFISTTNKSFYLMDEGQYGVAAVIYVNNIIGFDDINWNGWTIFNAGLTPYLCTFFSGG